MEYRHWIHSDRTFLVRFKPAPAKNGVERVAVQIVRVVAAGHGGAEDRDATMVRASMMRSPNLTAYWTRKFLEAQTTTLQEG